MKALNFIDLGVQTLILGIVVVISVVLTFARQLETIVMLAMYGAILLGPWQLVSSLVTCLSRGLFLRWRLIHLGSSIVYLVLISVAAGFASNFDRDGIVGIIAMALGFGIPIALALFYYYITIKSFQFARAQAKINTAKI